MVEKDAGGDRPGPGGPWKSQVEAKTAREAFCDSRKAGESGSIWGSLSLQFSGVNPSITASEPTRFMYELVPDADRAARRREPMLEFQPECHM